MLSSETTITGENYILKITVVYVWTNFVWTVRACDA